MRQLPKLVLLLLAGLVLGKVGLAAINKTGPGAATSKSAAGDAVEGLSLDLTVYSGAAGQPLQVSLKAVNGSREQREKRFVFLDSVRFDVTRPDGKTAASTKLLNLNQLRPATQSAVSMLTIEPGQTVLIRRPEEGDAAGLTSVYEQTLPGKYTVAAQVTFTRPGRADDAGGRALQFVANVSVDVTIEDKQPATASAPAKQ